MAFKNFLVDEAACNIETRFPESTVALNISNKAAVEPKCQVGVEGELNSDSLSLK